MPSTVLGGRYTVQDKIGTGGMAIVYRGLDNVLGRTVAIKTMLPQYAADHSFAARFKQEAQAAAALQSPYIVSVYDWGKDGDTYYIVMEYLHGTDLKSGIRKHGALDCRKVAQIGSQISQALSVAHRHDIIHRDIKPQNIMVQPDGNIKVMDFGIARAKNSHLTTDNNVLGTAHYVSPEQTQGKVLGPTSDIYSLGIVMYEAATGRVPFEGDDAISVALKQVNEQPVAPSQINPRVDQQLESIILKCMQKDSAARFQSADELSRVLRDYLAGRMSAVADATSVMGAAASSNNATQTMHMATPLIPAANRPSANSANRSSSSPMESATEQAASRAKKRRNIMFITMGVIVAAAVALFAAWQFFGNQSSQMQKVPNLLNLTQEQAIQQINNTKFFEVGSIKEEYSNSVEQGKVIDQDPNSSKTAAKGTKINLIISKGAEPASKVKVPDLSNMTPAEAEAALSAVGLKAQAGESVHSNDIQNGHIAAQTPVAGSTAKEGDTVTYQISLGANEVPVPALQGASLENAKSSLTTLGLAVGDISYNYSNSIPSGCVISASPTGSVAKGSKINLVVSNGPKPSTSTDNNKPDNSNTNTTNSDTKKPGSDTSDSDSSGTP
ncbi:MAG: Stk1 family PASTA domain-containing Ser/Thr kinase [Atopobium sp.]|uniref:Stk1 family PASTA domain-containing Ser/Thr kinase n=1 Tax=Atopobium sp. TaxID=1872650 RepID=UPI002A74E20B|nr:Stk1 family PASTA domain-containing Ser/Thr kinase [Atopobium sp.]MDY2788099.1 Stk1 family PASTA domain-containing Ser/Thr kinase [Atopobium sp.]